MSVKKAKRELLNSVITKNKIEKILVRNSENRILAEDLSSNYNVPAFNNSAVDGFGINFNDYSKKKKKKFKIAGSSKPGHIFKKKILPGEAIKIFTGAKIPNTNSFTIDTVIMNEDCKLKENFVLLPKNVTKGSNVRLCGEDIKKKKIILKKGKKIRTVDLGLIASIGLKLIKVYKKTKVGIFSSGDELSVNTSKKKSFQIFDSNKITLMSLFRKVGCEAFDLGIIKDEYKQSKRKLLATKRFDLIVTTGGISSGETDKIIEVINEIGTLNFWRLSVKPGRPIAFGNIKNIPFFGLPGNPVAVIVTFFMFVLEFTYRLNGRKEFPISYSLLPAGFDFKKKPGRTEWLRGSIKKTKDSLKLTKFEKQGSGILSSISHTEGIIELDDNLQLIKKGDILKFYRYEDLLN